METAPTLLITKKYVAELFAATICLFVHDTIFPYEYGLSGIDLFMEIASTAFLGSIIFGYVPFLMVMCLVLSFTKGSLFHKRSTICLLSIGYVLISYAHTFGRANELTTPIAFGVILVNLAFMFRAGA